MSTIDLVFEGGGAKGMVFIGALEVLFEGASAHAWPSVGHVSRGDHRPGIGGRVYYP